MTKFKILFFFSIFIVIQSFGIDAQKERLLNFFDLKEDPKTEVFVIEKEEETPQELKNVPDFVVGIAFQQMNKIYIFKYKTGNYPFQSFDQVYAHELSHIYLFKSTEVITPRWFDEGVAMRLSGEWGYQDEIYLTFALLDSIFSDSGIDKIENNFSGFESESKASYAISRAFVRDLFKTNEDLRSFIKEIKEDNSFEKAFISRFGANPKLYFKYWVKQIPFWSPLIFFVSFPNNLFYLAMIILIIAFIVRLRERRKWKKKWEKEEPPSFIQ